VRTDNTVAAFVQAWGPTLVLLFAVLLAILAFQRALKVRVLEQHNERTGYQIAASDSSNELNIALNDATTLNGFDITARNDPSVRLQVALRLTPSNYQTAAQDISQHFKSGRVVSIDLRKMDHHQAARLVDFCSGMTVNSSGWIFHVTDGVIVLTPPS
jgi:FtsZ-interacting cell division protein YlmF